MARSSVIILVLHSILLIIPASTSLPTNCSAQCGSVQVPYPFGIEPGCFRIGFGITCNLSDRSSPRAFLGTSRIQVTDISLQRGQVRVQVPVNWQCHNESGVNSTGMHDVDFNINGAYKISNTRNKLTVIGCNSMAYLRSQPDRTGSYSYFYYSGCMTYCRDAMSAIDGVCDGVGCCQTSFPAGLKDLNFKFNDDSHEGMLDFSPCSYVFVVDQEYFNFTAADLKMDGNTSMPLWLDWGVTDSTTCEDAKSSANYACQSQNSVCSIAGVGAGYLCNCSQGFQGNPYLDDGCRDINECMLPDKFPCYGVCSNTPGSYRCICPPGKRGDPFSAPCTADFPVSVKAILGTSIGSVVALLAILLVLECSRRMLKRENSEFAIGNAKWEAYEISKKDRALTIFTLQELEQATNNFEDVLGEGGQGKVYKGTLQDGRMVAIKKNRLGDGRGQTSGPTDRTRIRKEFLNELKILSRTCHWNVVRLYGCCLDEDIPILVYEYAQEGTLSGFLHGDNSRAITMDVRLRIAEESAEALAYLHESNPFTVFHGDVKSNNILLDETLTAKLSDFGASKLTFTDQTRTATVVQGTFGYMDPFFLLFRRRTLKSDVYSFGVVLLELVTRMKAIWKEGRTDRSLAAMKEEDLLKILDNKLVVELGGTDLLKEIVKLAMECMNREKDKRPRMRQVADKLRECRNSLQQQQHCTGHDTSRTTTTHQDCEESGDRQCRPLLSG